MSGPYNIVDCFMDISRGKPHRCLNPNTCIKLHNEAGPDGEEHHYGCECGWCQYVYWTLK